MYQVSPPCLCCAIKLINKGEHPCIKKAKEEKKKKKQIKENLIILSGTAVRCFTSPVCTNSPWVESCQVLPQKWLPFNEVMSLLPLLGIGFIENVELH